HRQCVGYPCASEPVTPKAVRKASNLWERKQRLTSPPLTNAAMHTRCILLLLFLAASPLPAVAQAPSPHILQNRIPSSSVRPLRASSLRISFRRSQDSDKFSAHCNYPFAGTYESNQVPTFESLFAMHKVRTLVLTQASVPVLQFWSGRLQLDAFQSTLPLQNVEFGPSLGLGLPDLRPSRQSDLGALRSVRLSGLSLSFHFGRDAPEKRPVPLWRAWRELLPSQ